MENYNESEHFKDKILEYASPLDIEAEWLSITEKRAVVKKNIIHKYPLISMLMLSIISIGLVVSLFPQKNLEIVENKEIEIVESANELVSTAAILPVNMDKNIAIIDNSSVNQIEVNDDLILKTEMKTIDNGEAINKLSFSGSNDKMYIQSTKLKTVFTEKNIPKTVESVGKNTELEFLNRGNTSSNQVLYKKEIAREGVIVSEEKVVLLEPLNQYDLMTSDKELPILSLQASVFRDTTTIIDYFKNSIRLELAGQGGFYSLNYERLLHQNEKWRTYGHVGIAYNPRSLSIIPEGAFDLFVPFGVTRTRVLESNSHLEVGIGQTLINDQSAEKPYRYFLTGNLKVGYRYQSEDSRFVFNVFLLQNVDYNNLFERNRTKPINLDFSIWGGIGFGYRF